MKSILFFACSLAICILSISTLTAQKYSNRYIEIERRDNKKNITFSDTMHLIYMSDENIIWQRKGGLGYKGILRDNGKILDFNFTKFTFSKNEINHTIELKDGNIIHILQREKAFDYTQMNHVNISIPEINYKQVVDIQLLRKKNWKLKRILDASGQIYSSDVPVDFSFVKSNEETIAFYSLNDIDTPSYRLKEHINGYIFQIENNKGEVSDFYYYSISDESWFLSDTQRKIFYYFEMEYRP